VADRVRHPRAGRGAGAAPAGKSPAPGDDPRGRPDRGLTKEGAAAEEAVAEQRKRTTARSTLQQRAGFAELSPEPGQLDQAAAIAALEEDPDRALALIAEMANVSDPRLRALARQLAGRVVVDLARDERRTGSGIHRLTPVAIDHGELDVDRSLDAIAGARARRSPVSAGELVARGWSRREPALCLLVDRSGSMSGTRLASAALAGAALALRAPRDSSVIAFARDAVVVKAQGMERPVDRVVDDLLSLQGHGTTDLARALRAAAVQLARSSASRRIGIVLSDGEATAGDDPLPVASGFDALHVIAPADAGDDAARLARAGNGRLISVGRPTEIPGALLGLLA
jgi:Mg-chelatase subunit ChlD